MSDEYLVSNEHLGRRLCEIMGLKACSVTRLVIDVQPGDFAKVTVDVAFTLGQMEELAHHLMAGEYKLCRAEDCTE